VTNYKIGQLVDPLVDRSPQESTVAAGDLAVDVDHAPEVRRITPGLDGGLVQSC
jgi:hypothetical protein